MIEELASQDLYELQARYVDLFDRSRALSLHLFEHVHGESRDRGQAMVDLKALYESHGLEITASELPDFLPLFLEYLSLRPLEEAKALLGKRPMYSTPSPNVWASAKASTRPCCSIWRG